MFCIRKFQSTLPARGATSAMGKCCRRSSYFNPRSPHGERQRSAGQVYGAGYFNPRSPHGERRYSASVSTSGIVFQSTLPARGATILRLRQHLRHRISIHAPRTGSDVFVLSQLRRLRIFQSTLPARGATCRKTRNALPAAFQSTLPARGATPCVHGWCRRYDISIHAPRTGSDL